jgi:predicted HicB family RNase H-like nuclease
VSITEKDSSKEKKLLIRLPKELHRQTKLLAYDLNVSMADLCCERLEMIVQKHEKKTAKKQF